MAIGQSLKPQRKKVDNNLEVILDKTAKAYNTGDRIHGTDEEYVVILRVGYSEALKALWKLFLYMGGNMIMKTVSGYLIKTKD